MGVSSFFKEKFHKKPETVPVASAPLTIQQQAITSLPMDDAEQKRVTLIATAIAAGDQPTSQFKVFRISKLKARIGLPMTFEEQNRVAAISSAILAGDAPASRFLVKTIIKIK